MANKGAIIIGAGVVLGGLALLASQAKAATPEKPPELTPEKAPQPPSTPDASQCRQAYQDWVKAAEAANAAWGIVTALEPSQSLPGTEAAYKQAIDRATSLTAGSTQLMLKYEACMRALGLDPHKPSAATTGRRYRG